MNLREIKKDQLSEDDQFALHAILEILGLNPEQADKAVESVIDLRSDEDDLVLCP